MGHVGFLFSLRADVTSTPQFKKLEGDYGIRGSDYLNITKWAPEERRSAALGADDSLSDEDSQISCEVEP